MAPTHDRWGALRLCGFMLIASWILFGPVCAYLFGDTHPALHRTLRSWRMYSGIAVNLIDARFYERKPDGTMTRLYYDPAIDALPQHITTPKQALHIGQYFCDKLGAGADVRLITREATRQGWEDRYAAENNLCTMRF